MKAISFVTCAMMLCVSTIALSQSEMPAQLAFARLKTLAGNWKGHAAMGPQPGMNAPVRVSYLSMHLEGHLAELDINPLMVLPRGQGVKAVDALVVLRGT